MAAVFMGGNIGIVNRKKVKKRKCLLTFFLFFMNISVSYFLSRTFLAASTMWAASIP